MDAFHRVRERAKSRDSAAYLSGTLEVVGEDIRYRFRDGGWRVPIREVGVIGEYTTAAGPIPDDYFVVFVAWDAMVYEASFYAEGRSQALATLSTQLGTPLELGLSNSTELRSRILWPATLQGQSLFGSTEKTLPGLKNRLLRALRLGGSEIRVSPRIFEYLAGTRPKSAE